MKLATDTSGVKTATFWPHDDAPQFFALAYRGIGPQTLRTAFEVSPSMSLRVLHSDSIAQTVLRAGLSKAGVRDPSIIANALIAAAGKVVKAGLSGYQVRLG